MAEIPKTDKIAPTPFFTEWKGHPIAELKKFFANTLLLRDEKPIIWLAGDSSLDNKAWVPADGPGGTPLPVSIPDIYTAQLRSLTPFKPDVAFWMNHHLGLDATVINTAVEASLLRERKNGALLPHDKFIKDNIRSQDVLVVSVGANDIALSPTFCTAMNMMSIAHFSSQRAIENGSAFGLGHFKTLFGKQVQRYISQLVADTKPAAVIICMIYYPLETIPTTKVHPFSGWADRQLKALKYDSQPQKLQAAIRTIYREATQKIKVDGTRVVAVPLFEVMDGQREVEYVERVEPSTEGGRVMSERLTKEVRAVLGGMESVDKDGRHDSGQEATNKMATCSFCGRTEPECVCLSG